MGTKQLVFTIAFILSSFQILLAQAPVVEAKYITKIAIPDNNLIFYQSNSPLSINDFEGQPQPNSDAAAITSSGFAFNAGIKSGAAGTTVMIQVYCTFNKSRSWMKPSGKTPYILQHEQHHFDISYIAAMRFLKSVRQLKLTSANINEQLTKLYNAASTQLQTMQEEYDRETNHGLNEEQQAAWSKKIKDLLQSTGQ